MKFLLLMLFCSNLVMANERPVNKVKYKTYFGNCPIRVVGQLTLKLVKTFEENQSLKDVKDYIIKGNLTEKYYISNYEINYEPLTKFLKFQYSCPLPMARVQLYKSEGNESYSAILVENGQFYDSIYEQLMIAENKIEQDLPSLALPVEEIDKELKEELVRFIKQISPNLKKLVSEYIVTEKHELMLILSSSNQPTTVFLGSDGWDEKLTKIHKIIDYMSEKKKIPVVINITNIKKVVVKFSDTI
ncbi:MAG: hypothetical protein JNM93_10100 [Bacteriovoracaceae bacterium]|nr:hypothetical protein [Bacteriovoracaceae bacterium]